MATHYSILTAMIRPEIQEKISIGFLLMDDNTVFFEYSKNKLLVAKSLLSDSAYKILKDTLNNIQEKAVKEHLKEKPADLGFDKINTFNKEYIAYLSRYNNSILSFIAPKEIELETNQIIFRKLYKKYIDSNEVLEKSSAIKNIEQFKINRKDELIKHFNIDREVTHNEVPNLIVPVTITLIGQNELPTFIQSLDLEKRTDFLTKDISDILFLQKAFSTQKKSCVAMAITGEPNKKEFPKQHDIWQQLQHISDIKNIDVSEVEKVIEYAEEHSVHPFLEAEG
jgi:hypothetical protein